MDFDAQTYTVVGQYAFNLAHGGAHETASGPGHEADVMQQAFYPVAAVGVYHLAVFGHDNVRGFVAILSHVVAAQVERRSDQGVLGEGDIAEYVLALRGPGEYLAVAYGLVLAVVQFQTVEVVVTAESLAVHHAPEIQVYTLVGVGGNVAAVVSEEEAETDVEVLVAVGRTAGCHVVGLFDEMLGRVGYLVVVDVYLRERRCFLPGGTGTTG